MVARTVDARGKSCPMPIVELSREIKQAAAGEEVVVMADDRAFPSDVEAWCRQTKNELVAVGPEDGYFRATVRKAGR
jgi:TusA-related sulfurtransferase